MNKNVTSVLEAEIKRNTKLGKVRHKISIELSNFLKFLEVVVYKNSFKNFSEFNGFKSEELTKLLTKESPKTLEASGEAMVIKLFKDSSSKVPAYKKFLKNNKIDPSKISSIDDFKSLPISTKKNYLTKHSTSELGLNGNLHSLHQISVSSGSTGEPFFWPRGSGLEFETALEHEIFMRYFFDLDSKNTLFIIGYAMGMYVAGVFTLNSLMSLVKKGYPLTIVSPGADKESILNVIKNLGSQFDQVVIAAYSPVLKDIIDKGVDEKINWRKYNLKFISGGEGFSEEFRKHMYKKISNKNYLKGSMNTYGSADAAILGHETPTSILVRKLSAQNLKLRRALFNDDRVPSLHQYYPFFKYFEEVNGDLVLSTFGGVPLVRYSIGDTGGVISFERMSKTLKYFNIDLDKEMKKYGCETLIFNLPFVYLFGRKDNTKIFYGANIYPEHIKNCLEQDEIIDDVTGKYFMDIDFDKEYNQSFYIAVELVNKIEPTPQLKRRIASTIHNNLLKVNDEYKYLYTTIGKRIYPTVELFKYSNPTYFAPRIKPKYVKKTHK